MSPTLSVIAITFLRPLPTPQQERRVTSGVVRLLLAFAAVFSGACGDEFELSVDLRTDLVPSVEFESVQISLPREGQSRRVDAAGRDFFFTTRVADFDGLSATSQRPLRVSLLDGDGLVVIARDAIVNQQGDVAVTLTISRDCRGIECADVGDQSCLGGRCVDPECVTGLESSCPDVECRADSECAAMSPCVRPRCAETLCLYEPIAGACDADEYCAPESGCEPIPMSTMDGGMDAGDAGPDVVRPPLSAPQVLGPANGLRTGLVPPRFAVQPMAGAEEYEFEFDASCGEGAGFRTCGFLSPMRERGPETARVPRLPAQGVAPVGTRYAWRVRACDATECGPWSGPRYVDVERFGRDFNGDGLDDALIGAREYYYYYPGDGGFRSFTRFDSPLADMTAGLGRTVHSGDFNGDGFVDAVIGAPFNAALGAVVVHLGRAEGLEPSTVILAPDGARFNGQFGGVLCAADFNADGFADLAIGNLDGAYIYPGSPAGLGTTGAGPIPITPRMCGDLNLDGFADLASGGSYHPGQAEGSGVSMSAVPISVPLYSLLGDLDADGVIDGITGGNTMNSLVFGSVEDPVGRELEILAGHQPFTYQVAASNDMNGDGIEDALIAWPGASADSEGFVSFVDGATEGVSSVSTPCGGCRQGRGIVTGLNLNGDAFSDALVGAPVGNRVFIVFGGAGMPTVMPLPGPGDTESYGQSL